MDVGVEAPVIKRKSSVTASSDLLKRKKTDEEPIGFESELDAMAAGIVPRSACREQIVRRERALRGAAGAPGAPPAQPCCGRRRLPADRA